MIILEDSRQQERKHEAKHKWFIENGIHWNRSALICGDYQLPGDGSVAVDTKKNIQELISDIQFKAMSKREIREHIYVIGREYGIIERKQKDIFSLITDDDSDRFAEKEISDYCFANGVPESALKEFQALYIKRHGFFHRGLVRAKNYGVKLYVLVDNEDGITDIESLFRWVNPRRKIVVNSNEILGYWKNGKPRYRKVQKFPNCMMGEQLAKSCLTMQLKYGCKFEFCRPSEAGERIMRILTDGKELKSDIDKRLQEGIRCETT